VTIKISKATVKRLEREAKKWSRVTKVVTDKALKKNALALAYYPRTQTELQREFSNRRSLCHGEGGKTGRYQWRLLTRELRSDDNDQLYWCR
jgi:hypothetical protein